MYTFSDRNIIKLNLDLQTKTCDPMSELLNSAFTAFNTFAVILLAFISVILIVKYYFEIARTYTQIRERYIEQERNLISKATKYVSLKIEMMMC
jgi:hypothetical protein